MREQVGGVYVAVQILKPGLYSYPQRALAGSQFDHLRAMRRFPFDDRGKSFLRGTDGRAEYRAAIRANQLYESFVNRHCF